MRHTAGKPEGGEAATCQAAEIGQAVSPAHIGAHRPNKAKRDEQQRPLSPVHQWYLQAAGDAPATQIHEAVQGGVHGDEPCRGHIE